MLIWHNGDLIDHSTPRLSPLNAGTLLGHGVFTTLGIWNGIPFAFDRHFARLQRDSERFGLNVPYTEPTLTDALNQLIAENGITRGMARITVTARGDGRWFTAEGSDVSIVAKNLPAPGTNAPLRLTQSRFRMESRRATSGTKSTSYADASLAWREAHERGFDEAVLCNSTGALCEGSRSNLFWARGETLFTPSLDCGPLPGIARELIIEWARERGIVVREGAFSPTELNAADEIFTTSATFGPRTVGAFDEDTYAAPGPLTTLLQTVWSEAVNLIHN
jgi:branched-chain amino acid aminotransferase